MGGFEHQSMFELSVTSTLQPSMLVLSVAAKSSLKFLFQQWEVCVARSISYKEYHWG